MEINIKNFAAIKTANIICDGVTIITGENGSGKSTIGKILSSSLNFKYFKDEYYLKDSLSYIRFTILKILKIEQYPAMMIARELREKFPYFSMLIDNRNKKIKFTDEIPFIIKNALREIKENPSFLNDVILLRDNRQFFNSKVLQFSSPNSVISEIVSFLESFYENFMSYYDLNNYYHSVITENLNYLFKGQVVPTFSNQSIPEFTISDSNSSVHYYYSESKKYIDASVFNSETRFFLIRDSLIIDKLNYESNRFYNYSKYAFSDKDVTVVDPDDLLVSTIKNSIPLRISRITGVNNKYKEVMEYLNLFYPYNIYRENRTYYTTNNGININNEASGLKIFALIKLLLNLDLIDRNTILFFDEPENHLHPELQLKFSKLVCLLNKFLGCKIICVTHSPTMLLAFDSLNKDKEFNELQFFAYMALKEDNFSVFENVSNNIKEAHRKLNAPYIKANLLGVE